MLANDTSSNKKMMILLTDGVPTFSYKVETSSNINDTVYGDTFNTQRIDEPGNTSKISWPYRTTSGDLIRDTWAATLGEAKIAKNKGEEIHALGIQLTADGKYLTADQIEQRMKLLASDDSSGNPLYDSAGSATDVTNYLNSQANDVIKNFNTINNGLISNPLGSQFNYNSDTADVKSVGSTPINSDDLPTAKISNGSLNVSNLNLGKGQEVQNPLSRED